MLDSVQANFIRRVKSFLLINPPAKASLDSDSGSNRGNRLNLGQLISHLSSV